MSYNGFAYIYDFLMRDVPYDDWLEFLNERVMRYNAGKHVLDLACGTGELSLRLVEAGFNVVGVDLSDDMLMVAQQKAAEKNIELQLFQQDMSALEGLPSFDVITIFCDSLNYLPSSEQVQETFKRAYEHLSENGLFLFDVHSTYKMTEIFANQTFAEAEEDVSYIWNCFEGEHPNSVEHELSFFVLDKSTDQYERFDELHFQRTYSEQEYKNWLELVGFEVLEITGDFTNEKTNQTTERVFFTCRKKN